MSRPTSHFSLTSSGKEQDESSFQPDMPNLPLTTKPTIRDKIYGTIIGSALGDTIGLFTEFLSKSDAHHAYPAHSFQLEPGSTTPFHPDWHRSRFTTRHWTDDTDHALLILLSFLHNNGQVDTTDFAKRLKIWVDQGTRAIETPPLGLGATVASVVLDNHFINDAVEVAYKTWVHGGQQNAANGSLMRIHPLGTICVFQTLDETLVITTANSTTTHADPRCVISCLIAVGLVRGLLRGEVTEEAHIEEILGKAVQWYHNWSEELPSEVHWEGEISIDEGMKGSYFNYFRRASHFTHLSECIEPQESFSSLNLDEDGKIGYVYKALGSAIHCLRQAMRRKKDTTATNQDLFRDLITALVMEGGDADTNACVAGAMLGAFLGYDSLPSGWRDNLKHGDWLKQKTEGLCQILEVSEGSYVEHLDTAPDGGRGLLSEEEIRERWFNIQKQVNASE